MIIDNLRNIVAKNTLTDSLYLRNLLKERLQYYILNYIYNSSYATRFLFKGGTCLRFCFDLPRLSEDLDFDIEQFTDFKFEKFTDDLKTYFQSKLQYPDLMIKISGRNNLIHLKFPIFDKINYPKSIIGTGTNILLIRIDISPIKGAYFSKEVSLKSTDDFSFLIKRYSLPDLYAGKLAAILTREVFDGKKIKPRFKARDYFDLFWLNQQKVIPNFKYLQSYINIKSKKEIISGLNQKLKQAKKHKAEFLSELINYFPDRIFVENFIKEFDVLANNINFR